MARAIDYKLLLKIVEEGHEMKPCPFEVNPIYSQCGMKLVHNLNYASGKDQARALARLFFYKPSLDVKRNPAGLMQVYNHGVAQILLTDVVKNKRGTIPDDVEFIETKKVSMRWRTAGPVSMNPNTENYIRHYTITPDMICDIYNFKQ